MKKIVNFIFCFVVLLNIFELCSFAESKNLCEELSVIMEFNECHNSYYTNGIDNNEFIEREVKDGQLYSTSTIISFSSVIYDQNPNKYKVVEQTRDPFDFTSPIVVQRPYGKYICVPEKEYVDFIKKYFNVNDALLSELRNFKVKDFTTLYNENGTAIFNSNDNTYIAPVLDNVVSMRHPNRKFIGYVRNGSNYDVYLNYSKVTDWETPPADKIENVDYYAEKYNKVNTTGSGTVEGILYYEITDDWMKYTVSFDGTTIKYLSNVKVNSIPSNLIRKGDVVPDEPPVNQVESEKVVSSSVSNTVETSSVVSKVESIVSSNSSEKTESITSSKVDTIIEDFQDTSNVESKEIKEIKNNNFVIILIVIIFVITVIGLAIWYFLFFKKRV